MIINKVSDERLKKSLCTIISFINAVTYTSLYYLYGLGFYMIKYCIFLSIMLVIAVIDLKTKSIYFSVTKFSIISALILDLYGCLILEEKISKYIYGAIVAFLIFFLIVKITKAMGEGDIEVAVICGLFLGGSHTLLTIILSFILGGIGGMLLVLFKNKNRKYEMAFAPYLSLGSYIAVFAGDFLINWYMKCY